MSPILFDLSGGIEILKKWAIMSFLWKKRLRGVAQSGLACLTGGQKVGGSNPLAPNCKSLYNKELCKAIFLSQH